jgi:cullin 1
VDSFVSLDIDESDLNKASLDIYKEHFEIPFLTATEAYYKHESESFIAENPVSDYLKKVEERLKEEEDRVERYLHTTTRKLLITKCEHVLIRAHSQLMWENFQSLLDYDKDEYLQRMYSLLSRIPEGLEPLRRKFEEHVKRTGLAAVSKLVGTDSAAIEALEPKTYVDALLEVHTKSSETVNRSFKGEAGFVASLDRACREFVNRNAATTTLDRSPELLAKHADALLRKNNKVSEESDLEGALNHMVRRFQAIRHEVHIKIHSIDGHIQVSRGEGRLQIFLPDNALQASPPQCIGIGQGRGEHDLQVEGSLRFQIHGQAPTHAYWWAPSTSSHEAIAHNAVDMSLSTKLIDSFNQHMKQNYTDMDITFSVLVLRTSIWPLNPPKDGFIVPTDIQVTYDRFQKYYQQKYSGRKLIWLWIYSKNELQTNYLNEKYTLMTSAYQTAVLLQYNNNDTLSLDELSTATNVGKYLLTQVLQPLVTSRLLINDETDQYDLNPRVSTP